MDRRGSFCMNAKGIESHSDDGRWGAWGLIALLAAYGVVGLALHFPGLHAEMLYDSVGGIQHKSAVFASGNLREIMGLVPGRPLFMLSLYVNSVMTGMDPLYFRLTTIVILACTGVAIALLSVVLSSAPLMAGRRSDREGWWIGAFLGLVYVAHPLQIFVVEYIWQRQALLATFFSVAALIAYVSTRSGRYSNATVGYMLTGGLFLAALLTKESAICLPAMLALAELFLFEVNPRRLALRFIVIGIIGIPVLAIYGLLNHALQGPTTVHTRGVLNLLQDNYRMAELTVTEVVATQCRVLWSYFRMIVVPFVGSFPLVKAEIVSRSLVSPPITAAAVAGVVAALGLGMALARKTPLIAFGIFFFVVTAIPEGVLSPQYLFFGYRPVLFMIGLLIILGEGLHLVLAQRNRPALRYLASIGLCVWIVGLSATTISQSARWKPMEFWLTAFRQLPPFSPDTEVKAYVDVLINYSDQLMREKRYDEATAVLKKAVAINPLYDLAQIKLAAGQRAQGSVEAAIETYRKAIAINPQSPVLRLELGEALVNQGRAEEGIKSLQAAVALDPHDVSMRIKLGMAFIRSGRQAEGLRTLQETVGAHPSHATARLYLGIALRQSGRQAEAVKQLREAVRIDPRLAMAHTVLGMALQDEGKIFEAQESFSKALALEPDSADAHYNLANCMLREGNLKASEVLFRRALELRPDFDHARANFGTVLLRMGKVQEAVTQLQRALPHLGANAELRNALGAALAEQGRVKEAADQFKKALAIDPNHAAAKENLERLPPDPSGG